MAASAALGPLFDAYGSPIVVAAIAKLTKWSFLQTLGHDSSLKDSILTFHGVKDALQQFEIYTQGNPAILSDGMAAIEPIVLLNNEIAQTMIVDPILGPVGPSVLAMPMLGAVFATSSTLLSQGSQAAAATMSS